MVRLYLLIKVVKIAKLFYLLLNNFNNWPDFRHNIYKYQYLLNILSLSCLLKKNILEILVSRLCSGHKIIELFYL